MEEIAIDTPLKFKNLFRDLCFALKIVTLKHDGSTIHIAEIEVLIENKLWNTAINRMYYACFYAVGALLLKNGAITLLKKLSG